MSQPDRKTPRDARRAFQVPRPSLSTPDAQRLIREAASAALKAAGAKPVPFDATPIRDATVSLPPPSSDPEKAQLAALLRENQALRAGRKASPAGGIPSVDVTDSRPPSRGDWAKLRYKVATAVAAALVLVLGALGLWATTAINAKTEAIKAAQEAKRKADSRDAEWRQWGSVVMWIEDCRDARDVRAGEMLLPDAQKMGSGRKLEAWQNPCPTKLPPPP